MSQQLAVEIIRQALITTLWVSLPLLAVMFVVGILVSLIQILTSIQDPTFSAIPRLAAFFFTLLFVLPWILMRMVTYCAQLFGNLAKYAH
ncbi:MAG TPA: flagellar biosynthetic protein FliQ [Bryobacteraceae bacterium]|jgi:flagellar biosynthetic protein FliQ|nr:flagellar biosynthetic protein FliQ [Bryobacteraceae bacterium]